MESYNKLKELDIKNPTCYFFDDIIKTEVLGLNIFLIDKKII